MRSIIMEEKRDSAVVKLLFKSNQLHQLEVHFCDPEETILRTMTLWNYQEGILDFFPDHLRYYFTIYDQNKSSHIVQLSIPEDHTQIQKVVDFESFTFQVILQFGDQTKSASHQKMTQYKSIAKDYYQDIKNKVLDALESQGYITKEEQVKMRKAFVRKPKGKKNFTDIFMRKKNGDIKGMAHTSTNNLNKQKPHQTPIIHEKNQDSLPQLPKLVKMNTSIDDTSRQRSFLDFHETPKKSTSFLKNVVNSQKGAQMIKETQICITHTKMKKSYRRMFIKTLENETKEDLNFQKQTLSFLRDFNEREGFNLKPEKKKENRIVKKKKPGIMCIYSKNPLRC